LDFTYVAGRAVFLTCTLLRHNFWVVPPGTWLEVHSTKYGSYNLLKIITHLYKI